MSSPILPEAESGATYPIHSSSEESSSIASSGVQQATPTGAANVRKDSLASRASSDSQMLSIDDTSLKPEAPVISRPQNIDELPAMRRTEETEVAAGPNPYLTSINMMAVLSGIMLEIAHTGIESRRLSAQTAIEQGLFALDSGITSAQLGYEAAVLQAWNLVTQGISSGVNAVIGFAHIGKNEYDRSRTEKDVNDRYAQRINNLDEEIDRIKKRPNREVVGDNAAEVAKHNERNSKPNAEINKGLSGDELDIANGNKPDLKAAKMKKEELMGNKSHELTQAQNTIVQRNGIVFQSLQSTFDAASKLTQAEIEYAKAQEELVKSSQDVYRQAEMDLKNQADSARNELSSQIKGDFDALSKMVSDFFQSIRISH